MKKDEYLNEEQFKKNNKKVKTAGVIILTIGIIMLIIGVFIIKVPEMRMYNWFELRVRSTRFKFVGFFLTMVGCMIRFIVANQRQISAHMMQQQMPLSQEYIKKMSPTMGNVAQEIAKGVKEGRSTAEKIYCKHCGAQIDADSNFCNKCGKQL